MAANNYLLRTMDTLVLHLLPGDAARLATCSKQTYSDLFNEDLLWRRIRDLYVATEEYRSSRWSEPLGWWEDFVESPSGRSNWDVIDYQSAIAWQMAINGKLDKEVFTFLYTSMRSHVPSSDHWEVGNTLLGTYLTKGWVEQGKIIAEKYLLPYSSVALRSVGWEISSRVNYFVRGDHLELFKAYDRSKGIGHMSALKTALEHGSPKSARYLLDSLSNSCICRFFEVNSQGISLAHGEFSSNKYKELPVVICKLHKGEYFDIAGGH